MADNRKSEDLFEKVSPERREFVKKIAKTAFVVPAIVSVSMKEQRLNLSIAQAANSM